MAESDKLSYKRLITKSYAISVKASSLRPELFAVGTMNGKIYFG